MKPTIEQRIRDEPTRPIDLLRLRDNIEWFTIPALDSTKIYSLSFQLISIHALDIAPMVLIEIREFVIKKNSMLKLCRDFKLNDALLLKAYVGC